MLKFFARRSVRAFERRWNYDGTYMHEILDQAGLRALLPLDALARLSRYRRGVPATVYHAAKLTAALAADCGPCAQLSVATAEADGVPPPTLRAIVAGDRGALSADERLGCDLARATLARTDAADVREAILARWGRRGLVALAYGVVAAQAFPTFKSAVGHAAACTRLHVDGAELPIRAPRR